MQWEVVNKPKPLSTEMMNWKKEMLTCQSSGKSSLWLLHESLGDKSHGEPELSHTSNHLDAQSRHQK